MEVRDTLGFLLGRWRVGRTLFNHRGGTIAQFTGRARVMATTTVAPVFGPAEAALVEIGVVTVGPHRGPASRRLRYRDANGAAAAQFADGREFVSLDLRGGAWRAVHDCGLDRYEIETVVVGPDVIEERWRVRGPAKDYDAVATFIREEQRQRPMARPPSTATTAPVM